MWDDINAISIVFTSLVCKTGQGDHLINCSTTFSISINRFNLKNVWKKNKKKKKHIRYFSFTWKIYSKKQKQKKNENTTVYMAECIIYLNRYWYRWPDYKVLGNQFSFSFLKEKKINSRFLYKFSLFLFLLFVFLFVVFVFFWFLNRNKINYLWNLFKQSVWHWLVFWICVLLLFFLLEISNTNLSIQM